jgi:hypothetical protein
MFSRAATDPSERVRATAQRELGAIMSQASKQEETPTR